MVRHMPNNVYSSPLSLQAQLWPPLLALYNGTHLRSCLTCKSPKNLTLAVGHMEFPIT